MEIKAKFINRTTIEYYSPRWNEERTKCGLRDDEQTEQGYRFLIESEAPQTEMDEYAAPYYEVIGENICQRWEIVKVEPINIEEDGTNSII